MAATCCYRASLAAATRRDVSCPFFGLDADLWTPPNPPKIPSAIPTASTNARTNTNARATRGQRASQSLQNNPHGLLGSPECRPKHLYQVFFRVCVFRACFRVPVGTNGTRLPRSRPRVAPEKIAVLSYEVFQSGKGRGEFASCLLPTLVATYGAGLGSEGETTD